VPKPLDETKGLRACERAAERGVPFTCDGDLRDDAMKKLEAQGLVVGTRRAGVRKTYWSITALGETALANMRAQAARDLAEKIGQRRGVAP
jgi:predicted MarR family transcription regulator